VLLIALGKKASSKECTRSGDVMDDSLLSAIKVIRSKPNIVKGLSLKPGYNFTMTVHRADKTGDSAKLSRLLRALGKQKALVILPVHPQINNISDRVCLLDSISGNFRLIDSLKYYLLECSHRERVRSPDRFRGHPEREFRTGDPMDYPRTKHRVVGDYCRGPEQPDWPSWRKDC